MSSSYTLGVVLAAGDATRLPNKTLLPIKDGLIAIESALQLCRATCEEVVIVVGLDGIVAEVLKLRDNHPTRYVIQPKADGVADAVGRAAGFYDSGRLLVTFADNIYGNDEAKRVKSALATDKNHACTRHVAKNYEQLDRWDSRAGEWVGRSGITNGNDCLAGWYALNIQDARCGHAEQSSIEFLNRIDATPFKSGADGWFDIGTPASYLGYLRS